MRRKSTCYSATHESPASMAGIQERELLFLEISFTSKPLKGEKCWQKTAPKYVWSLLGEGKNKAFLLDRIRSFLFAL